MFKVATVAALAMAYILSSALPVAAQWTTPPYPPGINPNGGYVMQGVGNIWEQHHAQQKVIEDLRPKRDLWLLDQQRKQQWLEQQDALRRQQPYWQQYQQQYQRSAVANSTPPVVIQRPVSPAYQQQTAQQWQQQSQSRQQALRQWNMQPLPHWGTATSTPSSRRR
jgi:hypothetical protein